MSQPRGVIGVTLARGGSKGVPKKNIRLLAGKPLIQYTTNAAQGAAQLDDYIVSTDDLEIAEVVRSLGTEVPFLRPSYLATDEATSADALIHAVEYMEANRGQEYEYVVEIMTTNPFKTSIDIDECIKQLRESNCNAVVAVHQIFDHHPARVKKIENNLLTDFCVPEIPESRRQSLQPNAFVRSGSIYAVRRQFLFENRARYDSVSTRPYILNSKQVINIDEEIDFIVAEAMLRDYE
jgi:CMP-N,N'-diacetyllegionaminic acid synthase